MADVGWLLMTSVVLFSNDLGTKSEWVERQDVYVEYGTIMYIGRTSTSDALSGWSNIGRTSTPVVRRKLIGI